MISNLPIRFPPCPRCSGRMLAEGKAGDSSCLTCGNVVYAVPSEPMLPGQRKERRPSHGGTSLS